MDGLSFVDKGKIPDSYKNEIDQLVKKEFANIKREPVHPEIRGILAKRKGPIIVFLRLQMHCTPNT